MGRQVYGLSGADPDGLAVTYAGQTVAGQMSLTMTGHTGMFIDPHLSGVMSMSTTGSAQEPGMIVETVAMKPG